MLPLQSGRVDLLASAKPQPIRVQALSAADVYLDAASYLPAALDFNVHPDANAGLNLPMEIQFSGYKLANGIRTPSRIQKLLQGSLLLDLSITSITINSGLSDTVFAVQ